MKLTLGQVLRHLLPQQEVRHRLMLLVMNKVVRRHQPGVTQQLEQKEKQQLEQKGKLPLRVQMQKHLQVMLKLLPQQVVPRLRPPLQRVRLLRVVQRKQAMKQQLSKEDRAELIQETR